jgi:hypothetical protein
VLVAISAAANIPKAKGLRIASSPLKLLNTHSLIIAVIQTHRAFWSYFKDHAEVRSELMIAYLTEIGFWVLVIFLCVGASYALVTAVHWAGGRMAGLIERAVPDKDERKHPD